MFLSLYFLLTVLQAVFDWKLFCTLPHSHLSCQTSIPHFLLFLFLSSFSSSVPKTPYKLQTNVVFIKYIEALLSYLYLYTSLLSLLSSFSFSILFFELGFFHPHFPVFLIVVL
ncbi:hypothetical protein Ancab_016605 [Ancistrocladus abbreviatus]